MYCKSTIIHPQVENVENAGNVMLRDSYKCLVDIVDNNHFCKTLKKRCFHKSTKSMCLSITVALCDLEFSPRIPQSFFLIIVELPTLKVLLGIVRWHRYQ